MLNRDMKESPEGRLRVGKEGYSDPQKGQARRFMKERSDTVKSKGKKIVGAQKNIVFQVTRG
jgi:hypothetical protein